MKYLPIIVLLGALTSCTALDAISTANKVLGEQPTLSVEAQVGDREANLGENNNSQITVDDNEGIVTVTSDASKQAKNFQKAETVNINEGIDPLTLTVLVLGWLLPAPNFGTMYREVKSWFIKPDKTDTV